MSLPDQRDLLRDRDRPEQQRVTNLELFFDLVYVLAVTQQSHLLLTKMSLSGAGETALLLAVVWWAWIYTTWMTNWFDPESVTVRLVLLVGMGASLVMAIAIPRAFSSRGLMFAIGYVGLQLARNVFIVAATKPTTPLHLSFRRILAWNSWVGVIWIAGGVAPAGTARIVLWCAALALDYAGPFAGFYTPGLGRTAVTDWEIEHSHFAERFQAFVLIALGESIVTTGATAATLPLDAGRGAAMAIAFTLAAGLWWLYFDEVADASVADFERADDARGELGRDAYTYLHMPIVAGIIVAAVGADVVIHEPGAHLPAADLMAVAAGPVIYLLGHIAFRLRMVGTLSRKRLAAALAVVIVAAACGVAHLPALYPDAAVAAVIALLAVSETCQRLLSVPASWRDPRSPPD